MVPKRIPVTITFFFPSRMFVYILVPVALLIGSGTRDTSAICTNDFEQGISSLKGWTKSGKAFNNQPTYGDNLSIRKPGTKGNHEGSYWIGTYEDRPKPDSIPGQVQSDRPTGTLTSPPFKITGSDINFLMGGGCDQSRIRAELLINDSVVEYDTGECSETMRRVHWSVGRFKGQTAKIRLLDNSSEGWGHLNFDDLKGDIQCEDAEAGSPTLSSTGSKMSVKMLSTGSPTKTSTGSKTTLKKRSDRPTMMEESNTTPMSSTGSPTNPSTGSKTTLKKRSDRPTMMEESNTTPMSSTGSPTNPSTGSKTTLKKRSDRPTMMEESNTTPMSSTGSPTNPSTGSKTTLKKRSDRPTMMEESNTTPMSSTGSPTNPSTGSKTTLKKRSDRPTMMEESNTTPMSSTGSPTKSLKDSKTTKKIPSGSSRVKGASPSPTSQTGSSTKATGSKTTIAVTTGSSRLREETNPVSMVPTGSPKTSTGSKTTVSMISGSPTKKKENKPTSMSTGSQSSASPGSTTTFSMTTGSSMLREGTNPVSMVPPSGSPKTSTGSKTTVSMISGSATKKKGNKPTSMSTGSQSSASPGSQSSASPGSTTTFSMTTGSSMLREGTNPVSMVPPSGSPKTPTGSKTTVSMISGSPTKKKGNKPTSMSTGSQSSASPGSTTTFSMTTGSSMLMEGTNPVSMVPPSGSPKTSTGSKTTVSMISGSAAKKKGNKPTSMSTGSQSSASPGSQSSASPGSATTVSMTTGSSMLREGTNPVSMVPTGSPKKPSTRNDTVSNKTAINFSPSKRMTTTQMNNEMKSLENLLYDPTLTKKLKQDDTGHSDDECQAKFIKVGCFADKQSPPRPLNDLLFTEKNQNDLQNGKHNMKRKVCRCAEEAKKREFKVFGLQFYDECWSGKDAEKTYDVHKTSSNCFNDELKPCKDTDNECVGGPDANYVYKIRYDNPIMDSGPQNDSTHNYYYTKGLAMLDTKPRKLLDSTSITNNSSNKPKKDFKKLVCKEFLVVLLLPVRWRDDLKNPATMYYKNAREDAELRLLKLYGEDEDFRGMTFEKFGRTENRNISKLYLVLKFDNTDNYLTKLIDDFGAQNVTAAGCYTTPPAQCPGLCPSICLPSCQPSCCMTSYQPQSHIGIPVDYTSPAYQQGYQSQPVIIFNTQPAVINPPIDQNMNLPLGIPLQPPATPQNNFLTSYNPSCPYGCQTSCSPMCPQNCCKSVIQNSQKRTLKKVLQGRRKS